MLAALKIIHGDSFVVLFIKDLAIEKKECQGKKLEKVLLVFICATIFADLKIMENV